MTLAVELVGDSEHYWPRQGRRRARRLLQTRGGRPACICVCCVVRNKKRKENVQRTWKKSARSYKSARNNLEAVDRRWACRRMC